MCRKAHNEFCTQIMQVKAPEWENKIKRNQSMNHSSVTSSTRGARSRFTGPDVSALAVAVVVAVGADSAAWAVGAFLDFFFFPV